MIKAAEDQGLLSEVSIIVEPTSETRVLGWLCLCRAGIPCKIVMPDSLSIERRMLLKAFGAELILTPGAEGYERRNPQGGRIVASDSSCFMPMQFQNPANPEIHRTTTAEEIWRDTDERWKFLSREWELVNDHRGW
jgi:cysteine synthase A